MPKITVSEGMLLPDKEEKVVFRAWLFSFILSVSALFLLPLLKPDPFRKIFFFLLDGVGVTFQITVFSICGALLIGFLAGLGRLSHKPGLSLFATVYVEVIRGIPLLVQLFYIYYVLNSFISLSGFVSGVIALSICYGAYIGEIVRAGILAVPREQFEAALALGLSRRQIMRKIVMPQAVRIIIPPLGNEFIAMLKDSSLVSMIAITDILQRGKQYAAKTFRTFETYTMVALIYLVLTLFFSALVAFLENKISRED